jgi:pyruvate/2-oxoglutarate dehydrogenase complex dihydrolipoamide dehydrogenase (E3) component
MKEFDPIIWDGQAGLSLAGRLTGAGRMVALVERKLFGGTCVNIGYTPAKTGWWARASNATSPGRLHVSFIALWAC